MTGTPRPQENGPPNSSYAAIVAFVTACCLAIELLAPEHWGPSVVWFLLAPAGALIASAIPALLVVRRSQRVEKMAQEKDDLLGLLLKDYAGERGDWVWSCDVDGRLRGVSQKFALHAGRASGQLDGVALADLLGDGAGGKTDPDGIAVPMRQRRSSRRGASSRATATPLEDGRQAAGPQRPFRGLCRIGGQRRHGVNRRRPWPILPSMT